VHAKHRLLYKNHALKPVPSSPKSFLRSPLLSPTAKFRAALEPLVGKTVSQEESVYEFLKRHFGQGFADTFSDIFVTGISAGNAKELSLEALFPRLKTIEQTHGSLIKGMIAEQKKAKQTANPQGRLTSFKSGGIQSLINALQETLTEQLELGVSISKVSKGQNFKLELSTGERRSFHELVLATPAFVSADLLEGLLPEVASLLASIVYTDVSVIGLAYDRIDVPQILDAFGFLVARDEGVRSLGVLYSSSLFADQAPEGKVMLRVIAGGQLDPSFKDLSDYEAIQVVQRDLEIMMGITVAPEFKQIVRWPKGIPQYDLGHATKVQDIMTKLQQINHLHLTGNAFYGVGVNDVVRDAHRVSQVIINEVTKNPPEKE